jgi:hypothetical protein
LPIPVGAEHGMVAVSLQQRMLRVAELLDAANVQTAEDEVTPQESDPGADRLDVGSG